MDADALRSSAARHAFGCHRCCQRWSPLSQIPLTTFLVVLRSDHPLLAFPQHFFTPGASKITQTTPFRISVSSICPGSIVRRPNVSPVVEVHTVQRLRPAPWCQFQVSGRAVQPADHCHLRRDSGVVPTQLVLRHLMVYGTAHTS